MKRSKTAAPPVPAPASTPAPPAGEEPAARRRTWLVLLLLGVVAASVYLGTLENGFVYDDQDLVVRNERIRDWSNIPVLFKAAWRPLKRLSLMVDYHLYGLDPVGFHATNIAFHALATMAFGGLVLALGGSLRLTLIAGLLFATHPAQTEAVAVITHRKEMMGTLFLLLALYAHIRMRPSWRSLVTVYLLFAASILSKEIVGATLPLLLLAYDLLYRPGGPRQGLRRSAAILGPLLVTVVLLLLLRLVYQGKSGFPFLEPKFLGEITGGVAVTYPPVLATALRMFWVYVAILLVPARLCAQHAVTVSAGFLEGWAPAALVGLVCLVGLALGLRRDRPLLSLGLLWLPLTILPTANVVPLTPWFLAERFLYLPSAGFCLALGAGLEELARHRRLRSSGPVLAVTVAVLVASVYGLLTVRRNRDWRSDFSIWSLTARQNPESILARAALGTLYHQQGRLEEAAVEYDFVLTRVPDHLAALTNMCEALPRLGRPAEAARMCARAVELHPSDGRLHNNLGNCYKMQGRVAEAVREYKLAARLDPDLAEPHINLGAHLARSGDIAGAARSFERAIRADPDRGEAHLNLGIVRQMQGDVRGARQAYLRVLSSRAPAHLKAQASRALAELGVGANAP